MFDKIREHIKAHKEGYICVGLGVAVGFVLKGRTTQIVNTVSPVFNNVVNNENFGGYMHKIVKNNRTGEIWETVKDAAEAAKVTASVMSRHLNGHHDSICGDTYSIIGLSTAA